MLLSTSANQLHNPLSPSHRPIIHTHIVLPFPLSQPLSLSPSPFLSLLGSLLPSSSPSSRSLPPITNQAHTLITILTL